MYAQSLFPTLQPTVISSVKIPETKQDLYTLIYANGTNNPATIQFHEDPAHGWLQVPHTLLKQIGIQGKISKHSYRDNNNAYLEEDCDLSIFVQALEIPQRNLMQTFWEICPHNDYNGDAPMRRKSRY